MTFPAMSSRMWDDEQTYQDINERLGCFLPRPYVNRYISAAPNTPPLYYIKVRQSFLLANEIFGAGNWSMNVMWERIDYEDVKKDEQETQYTYMLTICMRITLKDGTFREDLGTGEGVAADSLTARRKARKFAEIIAAKRTLKQFGSALGNGLNFKPLAEYYESQ